ncbi:MAG: thrombospondin type 3 repeat-containing protein [Bacteroidota bacterium]|nr:thrombospondin type 3 repeat-containing protein [Bacteroidota bacterium]
MKKVSFILALLCLTSGLFSQTKDKPWALGLYGGKSEYNGDLGWGFFNFNKAYYGFAGLSFSRYINEYWDATLSGTWGRHGYFSDTRNKFQGEMRYADVTMRLKLITREESKLIPYLFAGVGTRYFTGLTAYRYGKKSKQTGYDFVIPFGLGLEYFISKSFSLRYQASLGWTNRDRRDAAVIGGNDWQLQHSLGVVFNFGKSKDSDGDGVSDKMDKCPNTPAGVKVDKNGCPFDSDGDGVPDYLDKCPNTPAGEKVDSNGCSMDSDGDGVPDSMDKCPNTPAGVKVDANGCPLDSDGDGVADYMDKCPNTPAGVKVDKNGCPLDSDGDGVADYLDKCPDTPAGVKVDKDGCPIDTDGDGVPDYLDKCPTVKGTKENKGCPEVKAEAKKVFERALQGIQFETGKDVIKKTSNSILDDVVNILKQNPEYNLIINGHTDNVGADDKNMTLSENRAQAVKKYLVSKGIAESRLKAKGYGATMPVADNKTAEGRAKNRRVEFKVEF